MRPACASSSTSRAPRPISSTSSPSGFANLSEFRRLIYTPESAPSQSTLRRRIDKGLIPGGTVQAGHYYVDLDEFARATNLKARLAAEVAELEKNPLLDGLL